MNQWRLLTLVSFLPSFELERETAVPAPEAAHSWYILSAFFSSLSFELELLNKDTKLNPDDLFDLAL